MPIYVGSLLPMVYIQGEEGEEGEGGGGDPGGEPGFPETGLSFTGSWTTDTAFPSTVYAMQQGFFCHNVIGFYGGVRPGTTDNMTVWNGSAWDVSLADGDGDISHTLAQVASDGLDSVYACEALDTNDFDRYDFDTDDWTTLANLPTSSGGYHSSIHYYDSYVFMIRSTSNGGGPNLRVDRYDVVGDSWSNMILNDGYVVDPGVAVQDGNYVYMFGGLGAGWAAYNTAIFRYDMDTNTVTTMTETTVEFDNATGVAYDGHAYISVSGSDAVYVYDASGDDIVVGPSLPASRRSGVLLLDADGLHYVGGLNSGFIPQDTHYLLPFV